MRWPTLSRARQVHGPPTSGNSYVELSIHAGESETDIVGRVMAFSILKKTNDWEKGQV